MSNERERARSFITHYDWNTPDSAPPLHNSARAHHGGTHPISKRFTSPTLPEYAPTTTRPEGRPPTPFDLGKEVPFFILPETQKLRNDLTPEQTTIFDNVLSDAYFHQRLSYHIENLTSTHDPDELRSADTEYRGDIAEQFLIRSSHGTPLPLRIPRMFYQHPVIEQILANKHSRTDSFIVREEGGIRYVTKPVETKSSKFHYVKWWEQPHRDRQGNQLRLLDKGAYIVELFANSSLPISWYEFVESTIDPLFPNSSGPLIYKPEGAELILPSKDLRELTPELQHGEVIRSPFSRGSLLTIERTILQDLHLIEPPNNTDKLYFAMTGD